MEYNFGSLLFLTQVNLVTKTDKIIKKNTTIFSLIQKSISLLKKNMAKANYRNKTIHLLHFFIRYRYVG